MLLGCFVQKLKTGKGRLREFGMRCIILAIAAMLITSAVVNASGFEHYSFGKVKFSKISDESIDSASKYHQIIKDERGMFWFATLDGLYSFDGYRFEHYRKNYSNPDGSLVDNALYSILNDEEGLWIGSSMAFHQLENKAIVPYIANDNDIKKYIGKELKFQSRKSLPAELSRTLFRYSNGNIWLGMTKSLVKFDPDSDKFYPYDLTQNTNFISQEDKSDFFEISGIVTQDEQTFWLASVNQGLFRFEAETKTTTQLLEARIHTMVELDSQKLLLGTSSGLMVFDRNSGKIIENNLLSMIDESVTSIYKAPDGDLWIAAKNLYHIFDGEIVEYDRSLDFNIDDSNARIGAVYVDEQNTVLVGIDHHGVYRASPISSKARLVNDVHETSNIVTAINGKAEVGLYVGYTEGLIRAEVSENRFEYETLHKQNGAPFGNVRDIHFGAKEEVWIAEDAEIIKYANGRSKVFKIPETYTKGNPILKVVEDFNGTVWFTVYKNGIFKLDPQTGSIKREQALEELRLFRWIRIFPLLSNDRKTITFIKSSRGFLEFDIVNQEIKREFKEQRIEKAYEKPLEWRDSSVWFVEQQENQRFWVTHSESYISTFEPLSGISETIKTPSSKEIVGVFIEGGNFWLSEENGGILVWNRIEGSSRAIGKDAGLPNIGVTGRTIHGYNDSIVAGTKKGLVLIPKFLDKVALESPTTFISLLEINLGEKFIESFKQNERLVFNHSENVLKFHFYSSATGSPTNIRYRYRLIGDKSDWHETDASNRTAHYTNLPDGIYRFEVQSRDEFGSWGGTKALHFVVQPAVWNTIWAKLLYLVLFIMFVGVCYKLRVRAITSRNKMLVDLVDKKTQELTGLLEFKNHFVLDLTHELKTMLQIQNGEHETLYEYLKENPGFNTLPLQGSTKRVERIIDQLLSLSALQGGASLSMSTVNLSKVIELTLPYFETMAQDFEVELQKEIEHDGLCSIVNRETVERIFTNLIGNAIKYNRRNGAVKVKVCLEGQNVVITISDTGAGIPADKIPKSIHQQVGQVGRTVDSPRLIGHGIGLNLTAKAVELNGGTIDLSTDLGQGSIFKISFPHTSLDDASDKELSESSVKMIGLEVESAVTDVEKLARLDKALVSIESRPTILFIDDNVDLLSSLALKINSKFNLELASTGLEGYDKALEICPDLILTDLNMPGISGFELLKKVKANPMIGHIPVLLLTAMTGKDIHLKGINLGADDTICKPIDSKELLNRISNRLDANKVLYQHFARNTGLKDSALLIDQYDNNSTYSIERKNAEEWLIKLNSYIENNMLDKDLLRVGEVARHMKFPQTVITAKLKTITGISGIKAYIRDYRLQLAHEKLLTKNVGKLEYFAQEFGFAGDEFSRYYKVKFGVSPSKTKKQSLYTDA
jgi:signal transduction histidine kinase/CheY-like chemotaxis protein/ligand-binding sensor domain-containing protein/AraC-like DNA-binding protein